MKYVVLIISLLSMGSAYSDTLYCNGKIKNTYIDKSGNVVIKGSWANVWRTICNAKNEDVVTCSLWSSYAATALQNNLDVTIQYSVNPGETCESLPTYNNAPKPNYVMIHNPVN